MGMSKANKAVGLRYFVPIVDFFLKSYDNFVWNFMRRESLHPLNAHIILEGFQKRRRHPCQWKITLKGVLHDLFLQISSFSLSY